ncbi:MAG: carbonic anhydrase [Dehalococcoidia bacterium]|nr:carbonic anhydrase [Dehalococcoidia bacterium]
MTNVTTTAIDGILEANQEFVKTYEARDLLARPAKKVAIVACMDARIDPFRCLGLAEGDAHIIRNAGGRVIEALRSLSISQQLLGTEEVAIIHHTACGMATFTDAEIRTRLRENLGADADHIAFLPFSAKEIDESVRADLAIYRRSPIVRQDIPVRGFVYDVETGALREVLPD